MTLEVHPAPAQPSSHVHVNDPAGVLVHAALPAAHVWVPAVHSSRSVSQRAPVKPTLHVQENEPLESMHDCVPAATQVCVPPEHSLMLTQLLAPCSVVDRKPAEQAQVRPTFESGAGAARSMHVPPAHG